MTASGSIPRVAGDRRPEGVALSHTPGPWRVGNARYTERVRPWSDAIGIEAPNDPEGGPDDAPSVVAWLTRGGDNVANARLISAAPDMLYVCQEIVREHENLEDMAPVEVYCGSCNLGTGPHKRYCAYHAAKLALAKAAGEG